MRRSALALPVALVLAGCADQLVTPGTGRSPDAPVNAAPSGEGQAADRWIVVFRSDATLPPDVADRLVQQHGGRVTHRYQRVLRGFAAELPAPAVAALRRHPFVDYVEADQEMRVVGSQTGATWGLDRIDDRAGLDGEYAWTTTGAGVTAYVVDTGILTAHSDFGGRASVGYDALGGNGQDCNGHGTHVAGTIGGAQWGVAKGARLVAVRVLNCQGTGLVSGIVAGLDWVAVNHQKPAVANMSLGGSASSALDQATRNAIAAGVTFALAAGNSNADACTTSPARVTEAMTVGATDQSDRRASFSNWGACLDWFAPGVGITSAWISGTSATNTISGTSMAAPHTAGVAALFLEANPTAPPSAVRDVLFGAATKDVVVDARTSADHLLFSGVVSDGGGPNQAPSAATGASCTGLTCAFSDLSTDPDGWVATRSWSFGDGGTSSATNPSHTYAAAGTYTATLTVTDDDGAAASASQTVTVTQPPTPTITLSASWSRLFIYYFITLQWSGATTANVDVYVNGSFFRTTPNSGSFTAYTTARGTYRWKVCNAGTTVCSNEAVTAF